MSPKSRILSIPSVGALLLACAGFAGCAEGGTSMIQPDGGEPDGGEPDGGLEPLTEADIAGLEGVYQLDTLTRNTEGCDAEGDDVLGDLSVTFAYAKPYYEASMLELFLFRSCTATTEDACAIEGAAADLGTSALLTWGFYRADEDGNLYEESTKLGEPVMTSCVGGGLVRAQLARMGTMPVEVEIDDRFSEAAPYPTNSLGGCDSDPVDAMAPLSCTQLSVLSATRVGDL